MSDGWRGMFRGAAAGAAGGAAFGGWGAIPGAILGGAYGFFTGSEAEKKQKQAEEELRSQLAPEAYVSYAQTPEGKALSESLMKQVNIQAQGAQRTGLTTAGRTMQARGMLSSTGMQGVQQRLLQGVEEQRGLGIARAGETMGGIEAQMRQQWMQQELAKRLQMAQYWQQAGLAQQAGYEEEMGGLMQLGGTMLGAKYWPQAGV